MFSSLCPSDAIYCHTHTHIYILYIYILADIGSGNRLLLVQCKAITWTSVALLSIGALWTNVSVIWIQISLKSMHMEMPPAKWWPFCYGLNMLWNHALSVSMKKYLKQRSVDGIDGFSALNIWSSAFIIHVLLIYIDKPISDASSLNITLSTNLGKIGLTNLTPKILKK